MGDVSEIDIRDGSGRVECHEPREGKAFTRVGEGDQQFGGSQQKPGGQVIFLAQEFEEVEYVGK